MDRMEQVASRSGEPGGMGHRRLQEDYTPTDTLILSSAHLRTPYLQNSTWYVCVDLTHRVSGSCYSNNGKLPPWLTQLFLHLLPRTSQPHECREQEEGVLRMPQALIANTGHSLNTVMSNSSWTRRQSGSVRTCGWLELTPGWAPNPSWGGAPLCLAHHTHPVPPASCL